MKSEEYERWGRKKIDEKERKENRKKTGERKRKHVKERKDGTLT